jgi:hypothetical protein
MNNQVNNQQSLASMGWDFLLRLTRVTLMITVLMVSAGILVGVMQSGSETDTATWDTKVTVAAERSAASQSAALISMPAKR